MNRTSVLLFLALLFVSSICLILLSYNCDSLRSLSDGRLCSISWAEYYSDISDMLPDQDKPDQSGANLSKHQSAALSAYSLFDQFTISPEPCSTRSSPLLLLIIFSRPCAFQRRETIRATFGSIQQQCPTQVRILFIVGQVGDSSVQTRLVEEAKIFRDLIQSSSFTDGYGEASRKGISLIHWSLLNCPQATFTAKADDDCWINIPHYLNILQRKQNDKKILGLFWPTGASVIRDRKNKWAVHLADYPLAKFPPYVSGILYAFHKDILLSIAQAVTKLHYLWHDDVFLTGIAAQEAKVGHITLQGYDLRGDVWTKACSKKTFLAIHYVNDEKMRILWNDQCASYNISC